MADFAAVLKKTLDGLGDPTPAMRERVYEKARGTIATKLAALDPPPPPGVAERQRQALEEAIASVERSFAAQPAPSADPLDELESVFSSIDAQRQAPLRPPPAAKEAPRAAPAAPARSASQAAAAGRPAVSPAPRRPPPAFESRRPAAEEEQPKPEPAVERPPAMTEEDWRPEPPSARAERPAPRRSFAPLLAVLAVLVLLGGGGYAAWLNQDRLAALAGIENPFAENSSGSAAAGSDEQTAATAPAETSETAKPAPKDPPAAPAAPSDGASGGAAPQPAAPAAPAAPQKFTQRLTASGEEVDAGAAGGTSSIGEGTSVAQLTPPAAPAPSGGASSPPAAGTESAGQPAAPAPDQVVPVGQRAIFYEERTNTAPGSADTGTVVWSTVQESPGGDLPAESAIRAEATIPGKDMQLRVTIRRNADRTLPASHIIELIFLLPANPEGGGIDNVLRVSMKGSEQDPGSPLFGNSAKIADGYFLVALDDDKSEVAANLNLLKGQAWIDVPVIYKSGRRALFTLEKGIPGEKVFEDVLKTWGQAGPTNG